MNTNEPIEPATLSFRSQGEDLLLNWAGSRGISVEESEISFGRLLTFAGKIAVVLDPRAESSKELREAQATARANGISLYFLYPWDGDLRKLLSHFESKLGLDSRSFAAKRLAIGTVDNKLADRFMDQFHIQGSARGTGKISIALADATTGELLAIQQFARYRFSGARGAGSVKSSPTWEGLRLAFRPGVQIHGGTTRLQKFFEDHWRPEAIVSYVSASHSTGEYKRAQGFELVESKKPRDSYYWILDGEPKSIEIIDRNGLKRLPDLDICRVTPWLNPARIAGAFGKGVGETFYGGRLGSRAELRAHAENGGLVHNDVILEALGYERRWTPGQYRWEKRFEGNGGLDQSEVGLSAPPLPI